MRGQGVSDVLHSVINGKVVMRNRQLDDAAVLAEMRKIGEAVKGDRGWRTPCPDL